MDVFAQLKALRLSRGETLRSLAERIGVVTSTLSRWENGVREPSLDQLRAWGEALGVAVRVEVGATQSEVGDASGPEPGLSCAQNEALAVLGQLVPTLSDDDVRSVRGLAERLAHKAR